ncbi:MAG: acetyl-CoA carboxylase biotin carboxyl carrier protein [Caulobacterales bacterium]
MPTPKAPADPFDARLVRKLADILNETGLTEIEVEHAGTKIKVARAPAGHAAQMVYAQAAPALGPAAAAAPEAPEYAGEVIKSPMVGTVYLQPSPGSDPFVKVGDRVTEGQTLLIIEAMKTMNPIPAPRAGRIVDILVGDSQPVEFGVPLVVIE